MTWDHTLIPILPSGLIDVLDAPTPFLVGLRAKDLSEKEEQFSRAAKEGASRTRTLARRGNRCWA